MIDMHPQRPWRHIMQDPVYRTQSPLNMRPDFRIIEVGCIQFIQMFAQCLQSFASMREKRFHILHRFIIQILNNIFQTGVKSIKHQEQIRALTIRLATHGDYLPCPARFRRCKIQTIIIVVVVLENRQALIMKKQISHHIAIFKTIQTKICPVFAKCLLHLYQQTCLYRNHFSQWNQTIGDLIQNFALLTAQMQIQFTQRSGQSYTLRRFKSSNFIIT